MNHDLTINRRRGPADGCPAPSGQTTLMEWEDAVAEPVGVTQCAACGRPITAGCTWCRACAPRVVAFLTHHRERRPAAGQPRRAWKDLADEEVRLIRGLGRRVSLAEAAAAFGVSRHTIARIRASTPPPPTGSRSDT